MDQSNARAERLMVAFSKKNRSVSARFFITIGFYT